MLPQVSRVCQVAQTSGLGTFYSVARFNMLRVLLITMLCTPFFAPPTLAAESTLSSYRGVVLGDTVQVTLARLQLSETDVKVVYERPTLVQELTWRPHRFVSGTTIAPDALAEMVLTFHRDRLVRIVVAYNRDRTEGLTNADLHDALTREYGTSLLAATPTQAANAASSFAETVGRWEDAATSLVLQRERYPHRLGLTITSIEANRAMEAAMAEGLRLHASEAPTRELARKTAEAETARARDERVRRDNKATFKP
jgi:hypothetical protein